MKKITFKQKILCMLGISMLLVLLLIACKQDQKNRDKANHDEANTEVLYRITVANTDHVKVSVKEKTTDRILKGDALKKIAKNTVILISAEADTGYKLKSIKVDEKIYSSSSVEVTVTKNINVSCDIEQNVVHSLTLSSLTHGSIEVKNNQTGEIIEGKSLTSIPTGTELLITAIAEKGHKVTSIKVDEKVYESNFEDRIETRKKIIYPIKGDIEVSATFETIVYYSFTKEPLEHGRIIVKDYNTKIEITDEELKKMPEKAIVRVELQADEGWIAEELEITDSTSKDISQIIIIKNNLIAKGSVYKEGQSYKIEVSPIQHGSITITNKNNNEQIVGEALKTVPRGTAVNVTAKADENYVVESLTVADQIHQGSEVNLTIKQDIEISVQIVAKPVKYSITISPTSHGNIEVIRVDDNTKIAGNDLTQLEKNTNVLIKAVAEDGYKVENITVDGIIYNMHEYKIQIRKNIIVSAKIFQFNDEELIPISLSSAIIGRSPDYPMTDGNFDNSKGCFMAGRNVTLSPYKIGRCEVTWKLWKKVCDWGADHGYTFGHTGQKGGGDDYNYRPESHTDNAPVTKICHWDIAVWCNAYTEMTMGEDNCVYFKEDQTTILRDATEIIIKEGQEVNACEFFYWNREKKGYRLPTEAEWECAARWCGVDGDNIDKTNAEKYGDIYLTRLHSAAGAKLPVPSMANELPEGKTWEELKEETLRVSTFGTWWNGTKLVKMNGEGHNWRWSTMPVASKDANALGLYDMSGNVWEWIYDWHEEKIREGNVENPCGPDGSDEIYSHVIKGGHGDNWARIVATGRRIAQISGFVSGYLGFRIAKSE